MPTSTTRMLARRTCSALIRGVQLFQRFHTGLRLPRSFPRKAAVSRFFPGAAHHGSACLLIAIFAVLTGLRAGDVVFLKAGFLWWS